jgi:hypothetical protein
LTAAFPVSSRAIPFLDQTASPDAADFHHGAIGIGDIQVDVGL